MITPELRTTTLHTFRALLRAASYLPDSSARSYIHNFIIYCFRNSSKGVLPQRPLHPPYPYQERYTNRRYVSFPFQNSRVAIPDGLSSARRYVRYLQRAGAGDLKPLKNVLLHVYGRTGMRRKQLLQEFLLSMSPTTSESKQSLWELWRELTDVGGHYSLDDLHPAFGVLLISQSHYNPPDSSRRPIRHLKPTIPKENIWGRPFPLSRERNLRKRFWNKTFYSILPPLPESEWNRLRDLATGVLFEEPPKRRRGPQLKSESEWELDSDSHSHSPTLDTLDLVHIREPSHCVDQFQATPVQKRNQHHMTPRFMRRLWGSVWGQCPNLSKDEVTGKWHVSWGASRSAASFGAYSRIDDPDMELLEDMDQLGPSSEPIAAKYRRRESQQIL